MPSTATFGQRGSVQPVEVAWPAQTPERTHASSGGSSRNFEDRDVGRKAGLGGLLGLSGGEEDEFDIRLGSEYGRDHAMWLVVLLWLFLGGFGAHRLYLGHYRMMAAIMISNSVLGIFALTSLLAEGVRLSTIGSLEGASSTAIAIITGYLMWMLWIFIDGVYVIVRMAMSR